VKHQPGRAQAIFAGLLLVIATLVACSSSTKAISTSRPVTEAQAAELASVLYDDGQAGGAALTVDVPFGVARFTLNGQIDWANHVGRVTVHSTVKGKSNVRDRDVVWNPDVVFEQVPGLEAKLAAQGQPGVSWVARQLDPHASTLHLILRLVLTTSSTQRDNPQLLQSKARYLGRKTVDGVSADVFREGTIVYWIGRKDQRLHRMDAKLASIGATASLTFSHFGPRQIATPDDPSIIALDQVSDLYQQLLGKQN
jgi:hypothetical protein